MSNQSGMEQYVMPGGENDKDVEQEIAYEAKKVRFDAEIPDALADVTFPVIEQHSNLIPLWCAELHVSWQPEANKDEELNTDRPFEHRAICRYRRAVLWVTPIAQELTEDQINHSIVHELFQLQIAPLYRKAHNYLGAMNGSNGEAHCSQKFLVDTVEQTAESLAQSYQRNGG